MKPQTLVSAWQAAMWCALARCEERDQRVTPLSVAVRGAWNVKALRRTGPAVVTMPRWRPSSNPPLSPRSNPPLPRITLLSPFSPQRAPRPWSAISAVPSSRRKTPWRRTGRRTPVRALPSPLPSFARAPVQFLGGLWHVLPSGDVNPLRFLRPTCPGPLRDFNAMTVSWLRFALCSRLETVLDLRWNLRACSQGSLLLPGFGLVLPSS